MFKKNKPSNMGKLRLIGYILIPIGILGFTLLVPSLSRPRNPSQHFSSWLSVGIAITFVMFCMGMLGILSLLIGLIGEIPILKKIFQRLK